MTWDPMQYLKFAGERTRPAIDLIARIPLAEASTIVDLGCGAGNVSRLLAARWPGATITGVDSSAAMLAQARAATEAEPRYRWQQRDLGAWQPEVAVDLVFSNAALHWLDGHAALLPRIFAAVRPGGALAVQMPANFDAPSHTALAATVLDERWRERLAARLRPRPVARADEYYEWLAPRASTVDVWSTEYLHVLPAGAGGEHPVVAWTRGTALTPFLAVLDAQQQGEFLRDYGARVAPAYPPRADGRVLFAFRRLFVVALRAP
jgi:trans-aconitate 2-methyltransferase